MIIEKDYTEEAKKIIKLLEIFPVLLREQAKIFIMQYDETVNDLRAEKTIKELEDDGVIINEKGYLSLYKKKPLNESLVNAFWVFLNFVEANILYDEGRYPADIVFKNGNTISEVIVSDDDFMEKMDFLSKRKKRKNDCKYYILFTKDTIEEIDEAVYPDTSFTLITMQKGQGSIPKLVYHEVYSEESEQG